MGREDLACLLKLVRVRQHVEAESYDLMDVVGRRCEYIEYAHAMSCATVGRIGINVVSK